MLLEPLAACPPVPGSLTDTVKTVVAVITLPVAVLTFWLGYRQKDRERMLTYYHKVVVDGSLLKIFDFFEKQAAELDRAAREALQGTASDERVVPKGCTVTLAAFSTGLFDLKDFIAQRTALFDERITPQIEQGFEDIQDRASEWFNDIAQFKRREVAELAAILTKGQREIVRMLYRGQFRDVNRWKWLSLLQARN
jgi:hypothetical protein